MRSFGAFLTSELIRLITFPTRIKCASLSAKITAKPQKYTPPKDMIFKRFPFPSDGVFAEAFYPDNFHGYILHFHGGGRTAPLNNFYRKTALRLARLTRAAVISVDYPAGQYVYPAMHDYCFSAYSAFAKQFPMEQTILLGDSYGANLATVTAQTSPFPACCAHATTPCRCPPPASAYPPLRICLLPAIPILKTAAATPSTDLRYSKAESTRINCAAYPPIAAILRLKRPTSPRASATTPTFRPFLYRWAARKLPLPTRILSPLPPKKQTSPAACTFSKVCGTIFTMSPHF